MRYLSVPLTIKLTIKSINKLTNKSTIITMLSKIPNHHAHAQDWHLPLSPVRHNHTYPDKNHLIYAHDDTNRHDKKDTDIMVAEPELAKPPMYAVVMYNDDYTPMEFVVMVLQSQFRHSVDEAVQIMLSIHHFGKGIAGIFPKDIAETKAKTSNGLARKEGYPLLTQIEPYR